MRTAGPKKPEPKPLIMPVPCEVLLTRKKIARLLSISLRSFASMLSKGEYPKEDARLGPQQPRWRLSTHDAWVRKLCGVNESS